MRSAVESFSAVIGGSPSHRVLSPGRVNLIGDHTDYNDGFVMPLAIDRAVVLAFRSRSDRVVSAASSGREAGRCDLDTLSRGGPRWFEYVKGVAWALGPETCGGWDGIVASDLPVGAGLSSSAALELAAAAACVTAGNGRWNPLAAALASRRAENEWVGMECGVMDQLIVACAEKDSALLIDCRDLSRSAVPVPDDVVVVVLDTGTRRDLVAAPYNERRASCHAAAQRIGVPALRDADLSDVAGLPPGLRSRARHVVTENERVPAAAEALAAGDPGSLGRLMTESHRSLRDDFGAVTAEVDALVAAAGEAPGCFGARMTGAGFGGAAVAVVDAGAVNAFTASVLDRYGDEGSVMPVRASAGVTIEEFA
jgi:galactokinase